MPLKKSQLRSDVQLSSDGLSAADIKLFRKQETEYYQMLVDLDDATKKADWDAVNDLEYKIARREFYLVYVGANPKDIPIAVIREHVGTVENSDNMVQQYQRRIKSPPSGIRGFCMTCMGGQSTLIRECESMNCPLWPFRMGTNPFTGKTLPPVEDLILEDDATDAEIEEDDNEDAD